MHFNLGAYEDKPIQGCKWLALSIVNSIQRLITSSSSTFSDI